MNLEQAKRISQLSTAHSDKCTLFPNLGFSDDCMLHDHLLQHFVFFNDALNPAQIEYMHREGLYGYVVWAANRGRHGDDFTWTDANHLFRESIDKKIDDHRNPIKKAWYWWWRNVYYIGVILWRRINR